MSLATWKKEFYPTDAANTTKRSALSHSLRKWKGLTAASLKKHGCHVKYREIRDKGNSYLSIDAGSCALCHHHYCSDSDTPCKTCPLAKVLGTTESYYEGCLIPYDDFMDGRPEPMIAALEKAVEK